MHSVVIENVIRTYFGKFRLFGFLRKVCKHALCKKFEFLVCDLQSPHPMASVETLWHFEAVIQELLEFNHQVNFALRSSLFTQVDAR
jgi:hypothetical protein